MPARNSYLSPGGLVILVIATVSAIAVAFWPIPHRDGLEFWTFARVHADMYGPQTELWNQQSQHEPIHFFLVESNSLSRRALSAFWADTPVADLMEVERNMIGNFFSGPLEDIGFVDLTDRLRQEGVLEQINPPSFSPWTSRGRIFGLPHDVHPVTLWYRADIVEAAGIDVNLIETWDDFARVLRPLIADLDGDGKADRYLLSHWYTAIWSNEVLLLQAGGGTFDADGNSLVASEANAKVIATLVGWCFGPGRIAMDAPDFNPSGNYMRIKGQVLSGLMPDWLAGVYQTDLPQLDGKIKLMPLPAWEPGGRRTSVWGGTMLGITKRSQHFETAWAFAKHLYLSRELAHQLYRTNNIVSPVRALWDDPIYDEPQSYFQGQATGRLYIDLAPSVPPRTSSPMRVFAMARIGEAVNELVRYARDQGVYDVASLMPVARRLLQEKEQLVEHEMRRNVFLREQSP